MCYLRYLQVANAQTEMARLSEENERLRIMLTHLTSEYQNLQMHMVSAMQRHRDSQNQPAQVLQVHLIWYMLSKFVLLS